MFLIVHCASPSAYFERVAVDQLVMKGGEIEQPLCDSKAQAQYMFDMYDPTTHLVVKLAHVASHQPSKLPYETVDIDIRRHSNLNPVNLITGDGNRSVGRLCLR